MRRFALMMCLFAGPISAEPMTGEAVRAALTGKVLRYNAETVQDFRASGRTLYTHKGRESWGYWEVRGAQYCSQWPPNDLWACYDMRRAGADIQFVGQAGDVTTGQYDD